MDLEAWKGLSLAVGCIFISEEENEPMGDEKVISYNRVGRKEARKVKHKHINIKSNV